MVVAGSLFGDFVRRFSSALRVERGLFIDWVSGALISLALDEQLLWLSLTAVSMSHGGSLEDSSTAESLSQ